MALGHVDHIFLSVTLAEQGRIGSSSRKNALNELNDRMKTGKSIADLARPHPFAWLHRPAHHPISPGFGKLIHPLLNLLSTIGWNVSQPATAWPSSTVRPMRHALDC